MKKLIVILMLFSKSMLWSQTYQIINHRGNVKLCDNSVFLLPGDKINNTDRLCFEDKSSVLAVIDLEKRDRYLLKPNQNDPYTGSTLAGIIAKRIRQNSDNSSFGQLTLAEEIEYEFESLTRDFLSYNYGSGESESEPEYLIIGAEVSIPLSHIPVNDNAYFLASYDYYGATEEKKIPFEDGQLFLRQADLFSVNGISFSNQVLAPMVRITYINREKGEEKEIAIFRPNFVPSAEIIQELKIISEAQSPETEWCSFKYELRNYLTDFYGNTNQDALDRWFKKYKEEIFTW